MLKIQYLSDLHLEFPENRAFIEANPFKAQGDILVMAGDIIPYKEIDKVEKFFDNLSEKFQSVYWLPGNHEYYNSDIKKRSGEFLQDIHDNVFLLNNKIVEIEEFTFIFSTMWSELPKVKFPEYTDQWPDFRGIMNNEKHFSPQEYNMLYKESIAFLEDELQKEKRKRNTVVVTHHPPTFQVLPEKYANSPFREAFASDQVNLIKRTSPQYWIYGHCHYNMSAFNIEGTTLLTNQLGNVQKEEHKEFRGDKVLELEA